ncbi:MAG TPA: hypothetical protein VN361_02345 [Oxalicibacterium sp.]|nr:hypothetical protein [Oxalicibacterium sp.]
MSSTTAPADLVSALVSPEAGTEGDAGSDGVVAAVPVPVVPVVVPDDSLAGGVVPVLATSPVSRFSQPLAKRTVSTAAAMIALELFGIVFILISFQGMNPVLPYRHAVKTETTELSSRLAPICRAMRKSKLVIFLTTVASEGSGADEGKSCQM